MGKMIQKLFLAAAAVLWCFDTTHADANANATLFTWVSESVGGGGVSTSLHPYVQHMVTDASNNGIAGDTGRYRRASGN